MKSIVPNGNDTLRTENVSMCCCAKLHISRPQVPKAHGRRPAPTIAHEVVSAKAHEPLQCSSAVSVRVNIRESA